MSELNFIITNELVSFTIQETAVNNEITEENLTFSIENLSFNFLCTEQLFTFTIQSTEILNYGKIYISPEDNTIGYLSTKLSPELLVENNLLSINGITLVNDVLSFSKDTQLQHIAIGDSPSSQYMFIAAPTLNLQPDVTMGAMSLYPIFESSASGNETYLMYGITGYTLCNQNNIAVNSGIGALNFGNVVGLFTGDSLAGSEHLNCTGIDVFGLMSIFSTVHIKKSIGASVAGIISVNSLITVNDYVCSLNVSKSTFTTCPFEKILNIEEPVGNAENSFQMCLEGNGIGTGIWFNAPPLSQNITTNVVRIFADTIASLSLSIGNNTKLRLYSTGLALGSVTTNRVSLVAGIVGGTPTDTETPTGYWTVLVGGLTRYIPYFT